VETTSLHLFPLHRTAPSRHIHAASARSLYRLPLTALPAHPPQERRVCAVRIMKEEIINPSTSPEASSNSLTPGDGPPRKKQKRNKPTLSCEECVERKTKCDRSRPNCLACIKRQSVCKFSEIANLIAAGADGVGAARISGRPRKQQKPTQLQLGESQPHQLPVQVQAQVPTSVRANHRSVSLSSSGSSPFLLSNVPFSSRAPQPFFGLGSEHPFANYWTSRGGLAEVVGVLPAKEHPTYSSKSTSMLLTLCIQ